jgi:hypothetical protein
MFPCISFSYVFEIAITGDDFIVEGQLLTPTDAFDANYLGFIAIFILQVLFIGLVDLCLKMFSR